MRSVTDILTDLQLLGESGIADLFRENGVNGRRDDGNSCPVAAYLYRETGADRVQVDPWGVDLFHDNGSGEFVDVPKNVTDFILAFDRGEYPELDLDPMIDIEEFVK